ncbi:putative disease resistance RPP13-like protein 1 [Senna tora]|uniref:Putative disease resistance RPP13-like protein 1 n=1 Tax=Senna tora TaxID=362788 RepID=A0A834WWD9_9FABA|nr:putative disease resistance RPP13-like protein 1 [Senna tora]
MAELVGGAFLSAALEVAFEKLASSELFDFFRRRKLDDGLLKKLQVILISVNQVIEDAEERQYRNPNVKKWLDELKDEVFNAEDLLDDIDIEATQHKLQADESQTFTNKAPKYMRKLKSLVTRSIEIVVEDARGSNLKVLGTVKYLRGRLIISKLENIVDLRYVKEVDIKDFHLDELELEWGLIRKGEVSCQQEHLLDALQPNHDVKRLLVEGYGDPVIVCHHLGSCLCLRNLRLVDLEDCLSSGAESTKDKIGLKFLTSLSSIFFKASGDKWEFQT